MTLPNALVRDAVESDISTCIEIDHTYTTDYVWQMTIMPDNNGWQVRFRKERLPRAIEAIYDITTERLQSALPKESCFLVLQRKDADKGIIGYLTMRYHASHKIALVHDIVIDKPYRRMKLGSRLLSIARRWALEHDAVQLMVETQTKNFPAIAFCQRQGLTFCGFNDQYYRNQDIAIFFGQALR